MTIICALRTPDGVLCGSDTEAQDEDTRYNVGCKWHFGERWAVAFSGDTIMDEVLLAHWVSIFDGARLPIGGPLQNALMFSQRLRLAYEWSGFEPERQEDKGGPPRYPTAGGILTDGRRVWSVDETLNAVEVGPFVAEGCGRQYARGAYHVLRPLLDRGQIGYANLVEKVLHAAIHYHPGCGGEAVIKLFPQPRVLEEGDI